MTCLITVCSYGLFESINLYVKVHVYVKFLGRLFQNWNIFLQIKQNGFCFTFEFSTTSLFHYEHIWFILIHVFLIHLVKKEAVYTCIWNFLVLNKIKTLFVCPSGFFDKKYKLVWHLYVVNDCKNINSLSSLYFIPC